MPSVFVWADTSLGNLPNKADTSGSYIMLPLAWVSNKICRKVGSTLAAECLILVQAINHAYYLRGLLAEIVNREPSIFKMIAVT